MNKICTTIEQTKKLIELGLDVNTADMLWTYDFTVNDINGLNVISENLKPEVNDIPAWSLNSLLNIIKNRHNCNKVELFSNYSCKWILITTYYDSVWKEKEIIAEDSVDAAFEMVCWLLENNKI